MTARPTPDRYREDEERREALASICHPSAAELAAMNKADELAGRAPHQIAASLPRKWPW